MRTTAITAVVLNHISYFTRPVVGHRSLAFSYLGVWGVNCFFVLSGLLLGRPYVQKLLAGERFPDVAGFYKRRFLRIYPLYVVALALSIPLSVSLGGGFPNAVDVVMHVFMLQTLLTSTTVSINGPLWTMGIDAGFYLVLPLAALAFAPLVRGQSRAFAVKALVGAFAAVAAGSLAYRFVQFGYHPDALAHFEIATVYVRNLLGFSLTFCIGFALALASVLEVRVPRGAAVACIAGGVALGIAELAAKLGIVELAAHVLGHRFPLDPSLVPVVAQTLRDPLAAVSASAILFGLMQLRSERARAFAGGAAITGAATVAYAVYLIHTPIIENVVRYLMPGRTGNVAFLELTAIVAAIVLPIAYVLHRTVEKPFLTINERARAEAVDPRIAARGALPL